MTQLTTNKIIMLLMSFTICDALGALQLILMNTHGVLFHGQELSYLRFLEFLRKEPPFDGFFKKTVLPSFHWFNQVLATLQLVSSYFNPLSIKNMHYLKHFLQLFHNIIRILSSP